MNNHMHRAPFSNIEEKKRSSKEYIHMLMRHEGRKKQARSNKHVHVFHGQFGQTLVDCEEV